MDAALEPLVSIALGIGLAAAAGFRVFVPLLVAGVAARTGLLPLADGFHWLAGTPALVMLGTAAAVEALAYYVPGVDHALDVVAGPAAICAGIVASASVMADVPPALMWPLAIIAGGGVAGVTKGGAAVLRAKSSVTTAGLANPVVATVETLGSTGIAVLAVAVPLLCLVVVALLLYWIAKVAGRLVLRWRRRPDRADS
jgi:hypothetical protein